MVCLIQGLDFLLGEKTVRLPTAVVSCQVAHVESFFEVLSQPVVSANDVILLVRVLIKIVELERSWDGKGLAGGAILWEGVGATNLVDVTFHHCCTWKLSSLKGPQRMAPTNSPTTGGTF